MKNFRVDYSARKAGCEETDYREISLYQLYVEECLAGGDGTPDNPYEIRSCIRNLGTESFRGVIHMELVTESKYPKFFLPGFMYGRNRGETPMYVMNEFPRLRKGKQPRPASSWWMVRSDRLSHPAAFIYEEGRVIGFSTEPFFEQTEDGKRQSIRPDKGHFCQYGGFSCNLEYAPGESSVGYTLGYENAPWLFVQSHTVLERAPLSENCFVLEAGEQVTVTWHVYDYAAENEMGIYEAIQEIYFKYHEFPRRVSTPKEAVRDLANAVSDCAWMQDAHSYSGFVRIGKDGTFDYSNQILSLSWTNGFSVAVPLLMAANMIGNDEMRLQALDCMEFIMKRCMNEKSGLPFDACNDGQWSVRGWWFDGMHTGGHAAYLTGQFVYYLLKAYENEKQKAGLEHPEWIAYAEPIIRKVNGEKNSEKEYPIVFSEQNGVGMEYDGLGGAWCLTATAYFTYLTGDAEYLNGLRESEKLYYNKYIVRAECYGAPLDTDKAVDNEGVLAYVRACKYMHLLTGETVYLEHMKAALQYEFTFKFGYNVPIFVPPLSDIGWSSCGGSITSVANPHIHPMSSTIVGEMKYYYELTKDEYVGQRLRDTVLWGCQTYNTYDGEYGYGLKGWMSERFCYSQGLVVEKYPDGTPASTWFALMPWASCSVIEGLVEV